MVGGYQYIKISGAPKVVPFNKLLHGETHEKLLNAIETGKPVILDITVTSTDLGDERLVVPLSSQLAQFPIAQHFTGQTQRYTVTISSQRESSLIRVKEIE